MQSFISTVLLVALTAPAAAQLSVHVVDDTPGPGVDFADLPAAVGAAAAGDIVLVKSGTYSGFTLDGKSLVVSADVGASVSVGGAVIVRNLTATDSVALSGLSIANGFGHALELTDDIGPVLIERCTAVGDGLPLFFTADAILIADCDAVTLSECAFSIGSGNGGWSGIQAFDSDVSVYETAASGGKGFGSLPGGAGCSVIGGTLFASGCDFTGGVGEDGTLQPPFGFCTDGGAGGAGLEIGQSLASGAASATTLDCNLVGGLGGAPGDVTCSPGASGAPVDVVAGSHTTIPVAARSYSIPSPVRDGEAGNLVFSGLPGELVWVVLSGKQAPAYVPLFQGTLLPRQPSPVIFLGTLPASGVLSVPVTVSVPPGLDGFAVFEQAIYYTLPSGFVTSNPRLGLVLSSAF